MKKLRKYQHDSIEEAFKELNKSDDPILFEMSVGGGKSICAGSICKRLEELNKKVLCLVNSSDLVRNNSDAFKEIGGNPSIFCSSLGEKNITNNVIFGTPQSVIIAIKNNHPLSKIIFNLIIVDEADSIPYKKPLSIFMQILRHYKNLYIPMRLLGLTGTPFRLDNNSTESIIGENALFKKSVANITTEWLIQNKYLVKPEFGTQAIESMDLADLKLNNKGIPILSCLDKVVKANKRLTWEILQEVQLIMEYRNGAFLFCSTIAHCFEAYNALPAHLTRIIIGSTKADERNKILNDARNGIVKYIISVSCCLIGIDVAFFDSSIFLRRTESLRIFMQAIGRSLRLHPLKKDALVLDYAKNLETFSDIDHPIINQALQPRKENEQDYVIPCLSCGCANTVHARRCIGVQDSKRCTHYFEWKDCLSCGEKNDKCSRYCRRCNAELIDPNAKLSLKAASQERYSFDVKKGHYFVQESHRGPVFHAHYETKQGLILYEQFSTKDDQCCNIFYGKFVRHQVKNASKYYPCLNKLERLHYMLKSGDIMTPHQLVCMDKNDKYVIQKRVFLNETITS